jgi:hypothetical protein
MRRESCSGFDGGDMVSWGGSRLPEGLRCRQAAHDGMEMVNISTVDGRDMKCFRGKGMGREREREGERKEWNGNLPSSTPGCFDRGLPVAHV